MNWKIRFKKKSFWVAIVSAVVLFINNITQAIGIDYTGQLEQFSSGINGLLAVLVTFGVINAPTTKGMKDSGIAKTYSKPRDENVNPVEYQKDTNTLTPEEYDTSQPFTDDTDEVEFDVADYEDNETLMRGQSKFHDDEVLKVSDENDS
ncbi:phage holin [Staphylococcus aureus]|nr:phage holin [Staphylococcus aureus]NHE14278.1 phage holin [Staphylococcus aureus]